MEHLILKPKISWNATVAKFYCLGCLCLLLSVQCAPYQNTLRFYSASEDITQNLQKSKDWKIEIKRRHSENWSRDGDIQNNNDTNA